MTHSKHELKELKKLLASTQTQMRDLTRRHQSQTKRLRTQNKNLHSHITELEDELADSRADNDDLRLRCEELEYRNWRTYHAGDVVCDENYVLRLERAELVGEKEQLVGEKEQLVLERQELENSLHQAENEKSEAKKSAKKYETINITLSKELKTRGKKFEVQKAEWKTQKQELIIQKAEWETQKKRFEAQKQEWEIYEDTLRLAIASLDQQGWELLAMLFDFGKGDDDDKDWMGRMDERIVGMVGESGEALKMIFERHRGTERVLVGEVPRRGEDGVEYKEISGVDGGVMMVDSEEDL
ncbi:hypothetical protein OCU04_006487 [Sclerotinia nivalis]|uniref:Uncharacterized protein n=1 Tax=Sclerotinia nivalis TaxID=352851 RepID=A0A9X0DK24_9HELO|nr:hypothetical protein OCU04_006487 [Sclerotinia nivalis]